MKTRRLFSRVFALLLTFALFIAAAACSTGNSSRPADPFTSTVSFEVVDTQADLTAEGQSQEAPSSESEEEELTEAASTEETSAKETKESVAETSKAEESSKKESTKAQETSSGKTITVKKGSSYTSKEEVAAYLHEYGELPPNYITKKEAEEAGWISSKGNLWKVTDHKSIGGSRFMNYDEDLPTAKGRKYYECDIDYTGGKRNAKRIVYSNDGLIFYTEDHYESFEQLY